ncbi:hypothetical protein FNYG_08725 [Fusarium nygamai]|uniref:Uncharacterized protein n=1 Tax=Gibberella nygamai TaxID=42673 RepID=A0A2K0W6U5_GIBNY|nr:hypothetical protein FNYG_08725 [Fusarium nygamai]
MMYLLQLCCPYCFRRRRAGSSRSRSTVSDRPNSERRLGNRQPEGQEGGEPPQEVELPNQDAAEQSDAPQFGPQPGSNIESFPPIDGSPDVDNPSNDVSRQDPPQRDTGSRPGTSSSSEGAPQASGTQTNVGNPSNDVSQNDTPMPGSAPGSRSTATGPFPEYRDPMGGNQDTSSSSDGAPQANDTQTNAGGPSNDVESTSSSSDGDPQANVCNPSNDVESTSGSSDGVPQVSNTQTNVSNTSDNISQQGAPQHGTPRSRSTAAGSLPPYIDLMGGLLNSTRSSSHGAPQANNSQTNGAQNSSGSQRGQVSNISQKERDVLDLMTLLH